eukprot:SAG31_NODE_19206_length_609_cov_1.011765_1_plen_68_part_00
MDWHLQDSIGIIPDGTKLEMEHSEFALSRRARIMQTRSFEGVRTAFLTREITDERMSEKFVDFNVIR